MNSKYYLSAFSLFLSLLSLNLHSFDNYCLQRRTPYPIQSAYCKGFTIPAGQSRNFISEQLRCDFGNNRHTREPVNFDEESWRDKLNSNPEAARKMLRELPTPQWQGEIIYSTHLHWSWEDCQLITSSIECGTAEVCEYKKDTTNEKVEKKCKDVPKSCYVDVIQHESTFCSNEEINYDVSFIQTDTSQNKYPDRLANGYDLLPGEHEVIEVNNGVGIFNTHWMNPKLLFEEPRNKYQVSRKTTNDYDSGHLICQQDKVYHIGYSILALNRIISRSGNAFSLPKGFDGEAIPPLVWQSVKDHQEHRHEKGYPVVLQVQDYSAVSMKEFSLDIDDLFKNMVIRIQLYDQSTLGWPMPLSTIYIEEGKGVKQTLNAMSDDQNIRRSYLWQVMMEPGSLSPKKNLYRNYIPWFLYYPAHLFLPDEALSYEEQLRPGRKYELRLTVYQRGNSIYYQSCEDDPEAFDCQYYAGAGWLSPSRYENGYYSKKSLDISFNSNEHVNLRTWWPTVWNIVGLVDKALLIGLVAHTAYRISNHSIKNKQL